MAFVVVVLDARAQKSTSVSGYRLFPIPGVSGVDVRGYFGVSSEAELTRLALLDTSLRLGNSSSSFGLVPIDVAWQPTIRRAILLAYPLGNPALFTVPVAGSPRTEIFW